jgi:hypothetical protein
MRLRLSALACLLGLAAAAPAEAACLTPPEAESVALVAMPEIIRGAGLVCATRLPITSLVRLEHGPFIAKYDAAADEAWPQVKAAIVKLSDPAVSGLLQSQYARPLLVNLVVPQLVGRINPDDCGMIDRLLTGLEPLPPRNTAGLIVTALQYLKQQKAKGKAADAPDLPLCQVTPR